MLKRGIDAKGDVSNFVETEQILWEDKDSAPSDEGPVFSFVQVLHFSSHTVIAMMHITVYSCLVN